MKFWTSSLTIIEGEGFEETVFSMRLAPVSSERLVNLCVSLERSGTRVLREMYGAYLQQSSLSWMESEKCSKVLGGDPARELASEQPKALGP